LLKEKKKTCNKITPSCARIVEILPLAQVHADVELLWRILAERVLYIRGGIMDRLLSGLIFLPPELS
jgi:hypothetical protein